MDFCITLIITGIILIAAGVGGTIRFKIPQIGYIGGPAGVVLFTVGLILKIVGFC